jgi:hypothetical protein
MAQGSSGSSQARVDRLFSLTPERDPELAVALGLSQPTVWRLRNGKIGKPEKYLPALEAHLAGRLPSEADAVLDELRRLSVGNPHLQDLLRDLLQAIQFYSRG